MRFSFTILIILTALITGTAQRTVLDYLNADKFEPDGQITGIGLVEINSEVEFFGKDIVIYDKEGNPKIVIRVTDGEVKTKIGDKTYSRHDNTNPFNPRLFENNPDYFRLIFDCIKITDKYYQVIVDMKTNDYGFIKKVDKLFKYETVFEYVNGWTINSEVDFDRTTNPLRQQPADNGVIISNDKQIKYKIWRGERIEMKGDWLKVKTTSKEEGWIRWRQNDRIIIRIYFAC